jgi:hypothetical protein
MPLQAHSVIPVRKRKGPGGEPGELFAKQCTGSRASGGFLERTPRVLGAVLP